MDKFLSMTGFWALYCFVIGLIDLRNYFYGGHKIMYLLCGLLLLGCGAMNIWLCFRADKRKKGLL